MDYKISEIEFNDKLVIITLDSGLVKEIDLETFLLNPLVKNQLVSDDVLKLIDNQMIENKAYKYCIKLLAKQNYSSYGLKDKLSSNYNEEIINKVIERLKASNLINDNQFVAAFFENKQAKCWSINHIVFELNKIGFSKISDDVIESYANKEFDSCLTFAKFYKNNHKKLDDNKLKERLYQQLKIKGFEDETINNAFKELNLGIFIDY